MTVVTICKLASSVGFPKRSFALTQHEIEDEPAAVVGQTDVECASETYDATTAM